MMNTTTSDFHPERFRVANFPSSTACKFQKPTTRHGELQGAFVSRQPERPKERFIHTPLNWIAAAAALGDSKSALVVALAIRYAVALAGGKPAKLTSTVSNMMKLGKKGRASGLRALENAGLIRLVTRIGRPPIVEIIDRPYQ